MWFDHEGVPFLTATTSTNEEEWVGGSKSKQDTF